MHVNRYTFIFTVKIFKVLIEMRVINKIRKIYNYVIVRLFVMFFSLLISFFFCRVSRIIFNVDFKDVLNVIKIMSF
jgi:hypothetical protein